MKTTTAPSRARRIAGALGVTALTLALVAGCGSTGSGSPKSSGSSSKDTVTTKLLSFMPEKLTVKVGTKVTWKAGDGIGHTVTTGTFTLGSDGLRTAENPDGLINKPLRAGKDVSYTFTKPGKYVYYCSIHKGMAGEIDVTP
ncbi:HcpC [Nocardioides marmorisolisilvae]|uniref:HcpC n=1 Tax=Nocardioides marmorisolisilvae TaxID=1542737 RepID=A0A3N0DWX9_9ACTN|nr:HcpC [Nocardioides marmorisolisilvae]